MVNICYIYCYIIKKNVLLYLDIYCYMSYIYIYMYVCGC